MQLIVPQMLQAELVGRSPVERTELRDRTDVCLLGARRQIAHRHVVDHALAQSERSAWSSMDSCQLDCTNAQSSQTRFRNVMDMVAAGQHCRLHLHAAIL